MYIQMLGGQSPYVALNDFQSKMASIPIPHNLMHWVFVVTLYISGSYMDPPWSSSRFIPAELLLNCSIFVLNPDTSSSQTYYGHGTILLCQPLVPPLLAPSFWMVQDLVPLTMAAARRARKKRVMRTFCITPGGSLLYPHHSALFVDHCLRLFSGTLVGYL